MPPRPGAPGQGPPAAIAEARDSWTGIPARTFRSRIETTSMVQLYSASLRAPLTLLPPRLGRFASIIVLLSISVGCTSDAPPTFSNPVAVSSSAASLLNLSFGAGPLYSGLPVQAEARLAQMPKVAVTVRLTSNDPDATVPATLAFPAGSTAQPFTITTRGSGTVKTITLSGVIADGDVTVERRDFQLTLTPAPFGLSSLTAPYENFGAGSSMFLTARLGAAAPAGGAAMTLSTADPNLLFNGRNPLTVTIPQNQTSTTIILSSTNIAAPHDAVITGTSGGQTRTLTLHLTPNFVFISVTDPARHPGVLSSRYDPPDDVL